MSHMPETYDLLSQLSTLLNDISTHMVQRPRKETVTGEKYIDGDMARETLEWHLIADQALYAIERLRRSRKKNGDPPETAVDFKLGITRESTIADLKKESLKHYPFTDLLNMTLAIHNIYTAATLRHEINKLRRKEIPPRSPVSEAGVAKWVNGLSVPSAENFQDIIAAAGIYEDNPLPLHALSAGLLFTAYKNAQEIRKSGERISQKRGRRKNTFPIAK